MNIDICTNACRSVKSGDYLTILGTSPSVCLFGFCSMATYDMRNNYVLDNEKKCYLKHICNTPKKKFRIRSNVTSAFSCRVWQFEFDSEEAKAFFSGARASEKCPYKMEHDLFDSVFKTTHTNVNIARI